MIFDHSLRGADDAFSEPCGLEDLEIRIQGDHTQGVHKSTQDRSDGLMLAKQRRQIQYVSGNHAAKHHIDHPLFTKALTEGKLCQKQQEQHSQPHTDIPNHTFTFYLSMIGIQDKACHSEI